MTDLPSFVRNYGLSRNQSPELTASRFKGKETAAIPFNPSTLSLSSQKLNNEYRTINGQRKGSFGAVYKPQPDSVQNGGCLATNRLFFKPLQIEFRHPRKGRIRQNRVLAGKNGFFNHPRCQNAVEMFVPDQGLRWRYTPGY
ncbi:MAG TPA: hypothetical protein VK957_06830 [Lunatimonas sp.]|nr:hypothetical protein [Lunatimonas sp.]